MMAIINSNGKQSSGSIHAHTHHGSSSSCSSTSCDDENVMCPLCMENLDIDDRSFYPCTCGYQICRFCWHRIRSESDDENGLCPACRKVYTENPANFKPLSTEDIQKLKVQKRKQDQQKKQKSENGKRHLADLRVVQKNLVFVVGISPRIADPDVLKKNEFFGKFGKIHKVVVNPCLQGTTASAYITYIRSEDALRAIQSVNNIPFDGKTIKVSLGTTKYCSHFMRNQNCPKTECMYLHHYGDAEASFTKEDMQAGKHQEYEKKLLDEFNTLNNNNIEEQQQQQQTSKPQPLVETNTVPTQKIPNGVSGGTSKKKHSGSVQQGVSYSTKLLVNPSVNGHPSSIEGSGPQPLDQDYEDEDQVVNIPDHEPEPEESTQEEPQQQLQQQPQQSSSIVCSSSSNSICSDTENNPTTGGLEAQTTTEQETSSSSPFEEFGKHTLDLDFDPFLETQKVFQEIINEQVETIDDGNSLLRRFIKPHNEPQRQQNYSLGFQSVPQTQHQTQAHVLNTQQNPILHPQPHMHGSQVLNYGNTSPSSSSSSSLLLDFFNSYAYKHTPSNSIPPPPGFSSAAAPPPPHNNLIRESSNSSQLLDKLSRLSVSQNHCWDAIPEPTQITPDWMSLDPAIIFSKSTNEQAQAHAQAQAQRRFDTHAFDTRFDTRVYNGLNNFNTQPLIRPTPTSYGYNGLVPQNQSNSSHSQSPVTLQQQQQRMSPTYAFNRYYNMQGTQQQAQQQQQQGTPRYYGTQQQSTPPPPGFGVAKQPQYNYVPTQNTHAAAGFFPF